MPVALGIVAILYGARTIRRNRDWRSDEVLYQRILDEQPDAQFIRTNLGVIYFNRGDMAGAEREWTRSLGPLHPYAATLNDMGLLRSSQKRYDEAIAYFEQAMHDRPNYVDPYKNLAVAYAEMGRLADADREFRKAVELAPLNSGVRDAYGHFLLDQSRPAEAQEQFAASAENDPECGRFQQPRRSAAAQRRHRKSSRGLSGRACAQCVRQSRRPRSRQDR